MSFSIYKLNENQAVLLLRFILIRFMFVDLLFNLFRIALWPIVGKELSSWHYACAVVYLPPSFEPPHDKTNKMTVRTAKTQISLGIRPVWSVSSLSTWRKLGSLAIHWAHSEDYDQTGRMHRLIWVVAGHTCHFVGFVMRRLISPLVSLAVVGIRLYRFLIIAFSSTLDKKQCLVLLFTTDYV